MTHQADIHAWFTERIAAYLADGLEDAEQRDFDAHALQCAQCSAVLADARTADANLRGLFAGVEPSTTFEDRVIQNLRIASSPKRFAWRPRLALHPMVMRAAATAAAAVVLGGIGYVGSQWIEPGAPRTRQAAMASNLRQIGRASPLYSQGAVLDSVVPGYNVAAVPAPESYGLVAQGALNERQIADAMDARGKAQDQVLASNTDYEKKVTDLSIQMEQEREQFNAHQRRAEVASAARNHENVGPNVTFGADNFDYDNRHTPAQHDYYKPADGKQLAMNLPPPTDEFRDAKDAEKKEQQTASESSAAVQRPEIVAENTSPAPAPGQPESATTPPAQTETPAPQFSPPAAKVDASRKIIRHGDLTFEVDSFDSAFVQISKIAAEEGGFIDSTNSEKLDNGKVSGVVTVRVPPDHLDILVLKLRGLGDLKGQRIASEDITKEYTDLQSELRAAQAMEERLLDIIKTGNGSVKDLLAAEKEVGVWREKVEKVTGEINYDNNLISLSTLNINLTERDISRAALATETEIANMGIETPAVEQARADALKAIDDCHGRIIQSDLKEFEAGQLAATIVAQVPPEAAGPVMDRLKQLGHVARLDIQRQQSTAEGATVLPGVRVQRQDTELHVSLYNLANVAPRQTTNLSLVCDDVESAYHGVLDLVAKSGGRIVDSALTRDNPQQIEGTINFESPSQKADTLLTSVRALGQVMQLSVAENPDAANVTSAKRGFVLHLAGSDTLGPRETIQRTLAAPDVSAAYNAILAAAQQANAKILVASVKQSDPQALSGELDLIVPQVGIDAVEKAITDSHASAVSRSVDRSADLANTTEAKTELHLIINDVDRIPPRQTTTVEIEATDPEKATADLQAMALSLGGRVVDQSLNRDQRLRANVLVDVPLNSAGQILDHVREAGTLSTINQTKDPSVPDADFARARFEVTFLGPSDLIGQDQGIFATIKSGLATSVRGLLYSLELIIIGICLILPWGCLAWLGWKAMAHYRHGSTKNTAR